MSIDTVRLITYSYELVKDDEIVFNRGGGEICIESTENQSSSAIHDIVHREIKSHFNDIDFDYINIRFTIKEDKNRKLYKIDDIKTYSHHITYTSIIASAAFVCGFYINKYFFNGNDAI